MPVVVRTSGGRLVCLFPTLGRLPLAAYFLAAFYAGRRVLAVCYWSPIFGRLRLAGCDWPPIACCLRLRQPTQTIVISRPGRLLSSLPFYAARVPMEPQRVVGASPEPPALRAEAVPQRATSASTAAGG